MTARSVFVPGMPRPQGSKRALPHRAGHIVMVEMSKGLKPWRDSVMAAVQSDGWHLHPILTGPVQLGLVFVFPRPKHHYRTGKFAEQLKDRAPHWHATIPDGSKLQRAVEDALVQAGALKDDAQIAVWSGGKEYGTAPGVRITLDPISEAALS